MMLFRLESGSVVNTILTFLFMLVVGFIGGFLSLIFASPYKINMLVADPVAIANTFIVFTTIIFVGFTLVLALAGFIFTQQFSASKDIQIKHLCQELETLFRANKDDIAIKQLDAVLDHKEVKTT